MDLRHSAGFSLRSEYDRSVEASIVALCGVSAVNRLGSQSHPKVKPSVIFITTDFLEISLICLYFLFFLSIFVFSECLYRLNSVKRRFQLLDRRASVTPHDYDD